MDELSKSPLKILGVIDEEPYDPRTWSRSSRFFFQALKNKGSLQDVFAAEPSLFSRRYHQLKAFHLNKEKWKFKYHLDTDFYSAMTHVALRKLSSYSADDFNCTLQVGAWYDLTGAGEGLSASYHDGNLATLLKSPYGYPNIKRTYIDKALAYEYELYKKLDFIFPMSPWLADSFTNDFEVDSRKVFPVGAGVNIERIADTTNRRHDSKVVLMVGKDFQRKGGHVLLDAFKIVLKEVPDAKLRIIGPANLPDLPSYASCLGPVDSGTEEGLKQLLGEYCNAQIFAMPSLYEPFGIVFAEAMAHRLPCIGSDICAMPGIIDDGSTGYLVPPSDSKSLGLKIIELLSSPAQCAEMGENGYKKYLNNFTWNIVASKIVDILGEKAA